MNRGCIVVGYQGIGKSTLANTNMRYIDLESSNFFYNYSRPDNWYIFYCNIAVSLAEQGYVVFVSSHKEVRECLNSKVLPPTVYLMACVPSTKLKDSWIMKLRDRFNHTHEMKDFKAFKNAEDRFTENVEEIVHSMENVCILPRENYKLKDQLQIFFINHGWGIYT